MDLGKNANAEQWLYVIACSRLPLKIREDFQLGVYL
jgi:hypothetical protein